MDDARIKKNGLHQRQHHDLGQMREESLDITRTQQCIDSQPVPLQLGATPKGADKKREDGKGESNDVRTKVRACAARSPTT